MPARELNRRGGNAAAAGDARTASVDQLRKYAAEFQTVLPSHLDDAQWLRLAEGLLRRDPALARVAIDNPASFFAALLECARLGLVPGDTYHLLPFGRDVVGVVDYQGEIELMYRAGVVTAIVCEVVYADDRFSYRPGDERPDHRPDWFATSRGEMLGVYAYARLKGGGTSAVVVLGKNDIEQIKAVSKTARRSDSPWQQWPDRMWRKTAIKQLAKLVPTSAEFRTEELRAVVAAQGTTFGGAAVTPDYVLPPGDELPAALPPGLNTDTGELPLEPARAVEDRPDVREPDGADDLPYDPTTDPGFGGQP